MAGWQITLIAVGAALAGAAAVLLIDRALAARQAPRPRAAGQTSQATNLPDATAGTAGHEFEHQLQLAERRTALREALAHHPPGCQRLLTLLIEDPPAVPDAKISAELGIPIGRIAPDRSRCLDMLRGHPAIAVSSAVVMAGQSWSWRRGSGLRGWRTARPAVGSRRACGRTVYPVACQDQGTDAGTGRPRAGKRPGTLAFLARLRLVITRARMDYRLRKTSRLTWPDRPV